MKAIKTETAYYTQGNNETTHKIFIASIRIIVVLGKQIWIMNALRNVSNRKERKRNEMKFVAHIPLHIAVHIQDHRRPGAGG